MTLTDCIGLGVAAGIVALALYVVACNLLRSWRWRSYLRDVRRGRGQ